jgi:vacuolar-type H+-ATPase subunit E/Vma4
VDAERKAQSIVQQIQDKSKMEAERNAQSIIQQADDKAR